jgi:hypothetical protein
MLHSLRSRLSYANVMATLAVFIALGGTAMAATIITDNSQVAPDTIAGHKPPAGKQSNLIASSVNGTDVANNSLTGSDIKDRSGVDTCQSPLTVQLGSICAGSDGNARNWNGALGYCAGLRLRLPSVSEAVAMAENHTVPGVPGGQAFWTDELLYENGFDAVIVDLSRGNHLADETTPEPTVCVTDPSA